jgi:opacity protein-like surface antigen
MTPMVRLLRWLIFPLTAIIAVLTANPAPARSIERSHWGKLRLQGVASMATGHNGVEAWNSCDNSFFSFLDFTSSIEVNDTWGVLGSFEYVFARKYGIEVTFLYWWELVELRFETEGIEIEGAPNFILPVLGGNYRFLTRGDTDLYAGVIVGLGLLATGNPVGDIEIGSDVALGLNLGLDHYVSDSWSVGCSVKYVDFGEVDFSIFPPGVGGLICNNGLFGIGSMSLVSLTLGIGLRL